MSGVVSAPAAVDFESHFVTPEYFEALETNCGYPRYLREKDMIQWRTDVFMPQNPVAAYMSLASAKRLETMDKCGIQTAVLSCSPGLEQLPAEMGVSACQAVNDAVFQMTASFPGRFLGSAILPVGDPRAACRELERCVKELGFVCWHTHSNYGSWGPDCEALRPIFALAAKLGIYVHLHPQIPNWERLDGFGFPLAGAGLGFTLDAMTTITRMILSGLFDELPSLKVLLGHLGEALPYLLERMESRITGIPDPRVKKRQPLRRYFRTNIWVSTSGNLSAEAFTCCRQVLGLDRMVFASDYPHESPEKFLAFLRGLPLSGEELCTVLVRNGETLLSPALYKE